jgi:hypothetical protein
MSSESKIVLPPSVENQIDTLFKKNEFEAFQELADIFKQAVLQKSDPHGMRTLRNEQFTLSKIVKVLDLNVSHRARQYKATMKHATTYEWSDEILAEIEPVRGGKHQVPCEIWFTPYGFLRCFSVFPNKKFSKTIVNLSFKVLVWALTTQAQYHTKLITQNEELHEEFEVLFKEHEEAEDHLRDAEHHLQETQNDFNARKYSPWKEFCELKGVSEDHTRWPGPRKRALWQAFNNAREAGHFTKDTNTCYYYTSVGSRLTARNYCWSN